MEYEKNARSSVEINIKLLKIVHFLIASLSVVETKQRRCRDKVASVEEIHASNNAQVNCKTIRLTLFGL